MDKEHPRRKKGFPIEKSSFAAIILGTVSGVLFTRGMVMALVPKLGALAPGNVLSCIGLVFALITIFVWNRMAHQAPIHLSDKTLPSILLGIVGALGLGVGMCLCMVWA